jgi:hypothetical protein
MFSMCADALARQLFVDDRMPVDKAVGTFIVCSPGLDLLYGQAKETAFTNQLDCYTPG